MRNELRMVGPPGTGKTTALAQQISYEAKKRGASAVIALSLTNAAANEIASRHVPLPEGNVGTLHSIAYRGLGCPRLLQDKNGLAGFNEKCRDKHCLSGEVGEGRLESGDVVGSTDGDKLMQAYQLLRNRMVAREKWPADIAAFAHEWEQYKRGEDGVDFTDILELAIEELPEAPGAPEIIVADEFQDFSRLAMHLLWQWAEECESLISGGDPDQCLYGFAGSAPSTFIDNPPAKQHVLEQSYRVPRAIHQFAMSWIERNDERDPVVYKPRDCDGRVLKLATTYANPKRLVDMLAEDCAVGRSCMVLASCGYMLSPLIKILRAEGIPYHNPYSPGRTVWNPLSHRMKGGVTAAESVAAYVAPWVHADARPSPWVDDEVRGWTVGEVAKWTKITKGLRGRGEYIEDSTGGRASDDSRCSAEQIMTYIPATAKALALIEGGPGGLEVLKAHLRKGVGTAGAYALKVASCHGVEAVVDAPTLVLGTIHSVKGGEADRVYLWPDLSRQGKDACCKREGMEATRRLMYVAATRAREELVLLLASSENSIAWGA